MLKLGKKFLTNKKYKNFDEIKKSLKNYRENITKIKKKIDLLNIRWNLKKIVSFLRQFYVNFRNHQDS